MDVDAFLNALPASITLAHQDDGYVLTPTHQDELGQILVTAQDEGIPLQPRLGQSSHNGRSILVDPVHLSHIRRFRQNEFLITAETGCTIGDLNSQLAKYGQRFPLAYHSSRKLLSLAGFDTPSLSNIAYGTFRQQITGLQALTGLGEPIHYGGDVVKNVTGYDLIAFYVGSRHQYGWVTELTVKTIPIPPYERRMVLDLEQSQNALDKMDWLRHSLLTLKGLAMFRLRATFGWKCLLDCSGYPAPLQQDLNLISNWLEDLGPGVHDLDCGESGFDHWLDKLDWERTGQAYNLTLRMALTLKHARAFIEEHSFEAWFQGADCLWLPGSNLIYLRWRSPNYAYVEELQHIYDWCHDHRGLIEMVTVPVNYELPLHLITMPDPSIVERWKKRLNEQFNSNNVLQAVGRQSHWQEG